MPPVAPSSMDQLTEVMEAPVTVAVNCARPVSGSVTAEGPTLTVTPLPVLTVTTASPYVVPSAALVARTWKMPAPPGAE